MEIWKDIDGYGGRYQVSSQGKVRRLLQTDHHGGYSACLTNMILHTTPKGYKTVGLIKNGKSKVFLVHRLVAIAFLENPENKKCINRIDYDRSNNCVTNLEWCTYAENNQHSYERIHCERHVIKSNTGYKYISKNQAGYYYVSFKKGDGLAKNFKSLDDALSYRNSVLESRGKQHV